MSADDTTIDSFPVADLLRYSAPYFIHEVFGYRVDGMHMNILDHVQNNRFTLDLAPRGHGKSRMIIGYFTWLAVNNPDIRILICSDTDMHAQNFLRTIKNTIENSDLIKEHYGNLVGNRWTDHVIELKGRNQIYTEGTITAVGAMSGAATGLHFDVIGCDDLANFDNSRSELQRERMKTWFRTTLLPTLMSDGSVHIVGTRYHFADLYQMVIEELKYDTNILPAIQDDGTALCRWLQPLEDIVDEKGEMVKKGLLSIKNDLGSVIFGLQYQNNVDLLKEGNIFKWEWIRYYDEIIHSDGEVYVRRGDPKVKILKKFLGVDLAISEKDTADYTVITCVGQGEDKKLYVLDVERGHWTFQRQKDEIIKMVGKWNPDRTIVESVAYQKAMVEELKSMGGLKIQDVTPTRDKVSRANMVTGWFENGNIFFGRGMSGLVDELLLFPDGSHDDQVDSLCYAINGFKMGVSAVVLMEL